jgi:Phosphoserine phosphatase RsbU, N-terminal domain
MGVPKVLFCRRYRAALLDYLLGNGETGLARAHDLGRRAIEDGLGLLQILRAHQQALTAVLDSTHTSSENLSTLKAAEDFLLETLSPFEMTHRGYVALLQREQQQARSVRSRTATRVAARSVSEKWHE